ncbi:inositol monophosphatase [Paludifilum halophilum]|uniref:Inositol-1-monophosphatase n=2 Tax=Paludifilum halophilum TaxID=1642702 RepID=A0A235B2M2_9BACL|nr:inositol monophosphatase [Paludifilum halophilum]
MEKRMDTDKRVNYKTSSHDLVTEVDQECEKIIRETLQASYPDHQVLGEEGVEAGSEASRAALEAAREAEYLWIIDPIDGTTNFVHRFPFFCVSIGIAHQGEIIAGVIFDPVQNELFVAEKGKGATLNGERIRVSQEKTLETSLLATGFPAGIREARQVNINGILELGTKCRNIRTAGSAALHLAYVASGRLTGFWEIDLNAWDLAAGALLVKEAGGRVTDTTGQPYHIGVRNILATNGLIHDSVQRTLKDVKATGFES